MAAAKLKDLAEIQETNVTEPRIPSPPKIKIDVIRRAEIGREKRARTRDQILKTAFDLLGHDRGRSTRVEEICASSGLARATFYKYFKSMDELFEALSYDLSHQFNSAVTRALAQLPTAAERISAAVRFYHQRAIDDPKWGWAMVHISGGGPIFGADTYAHAQADVEFGIARGEFLLPDFNLGRDIILGTGLAAMITQLRHSPSAGCPRTIARHILLGLGVSPRKAESITDQSLPILH